MYFRNSRNRMTLLLQSKAHMINDACIIVGNPSSSPYAYKLRLAHKRIIFTRVKILSINMPLDSNVYAYLPPVLKMHVSVIQSDRQQYERW